MRLGQLAALAPVIVAALCTAIGVETSGCGRRAPMNAVEDAPLLPARPLVDGKPPPTKALVTANHKGKVFSFAPNAADGGVSETRF